jgi:hypothetical protein
VLNAFAVITSSTKDTSLPSDGIKLNLLGGTKSLLLVLIVDIVVLPKTLTTPILPLT